MSSTPREGAILSRVLTKLLVSIGLLLEWRHGIKVLLGSTRSKYFSDLS